VSVSVIVLVSAPELDPQRRLQRAGMPGILAHAVEHIRGMEPHVELLPRRRDQRPLDGVEGGVRPAASHRLVDGVGHHLAGHARRRPFAIAVGPGGDALGRDFLLVTVERDAVDRVGGRAAPDRLVGGETHLGDAGRVGLVEDSLGNDVQEGARVLRLVRLDDVEPIVGKALAQSIFYGRAVRVVERRVFRQFFLHVLEHVLAWGRVRRAGQRADQE
jgi:hypothetical protein